MSSSRARHTYNQRRVAIKLLLPRGSGEKETVARFFREARAAASLRHPNVVEILDTGEDEDGEAYIVMEYLDGESLRERLRRDGPLGVAETLAILKPVMDGLALAHGRGIVHRDLKPDNIFLCVSSDGAIVPKLLDFGVAKLVEPTGTLATRTGSLLGTPDYMSPEQALGESGVGPAADIWALGVILFECLAGRRPFAASSVPALLLAITKDPAPALSDHVGTVDPAVERSVARALAKSPADRFASVEEFGDALTGGSAASEIEPDAVVSQPPAVSESDALEPSRVAATVALRSANDAPNATLPLAPQTSEPAVATLPLEDLGARAEVAVPTASPERSGRRWPVIAGIAVAVLFGVAVGVGAFALREESAPPVTRRIVSVPPGATAQIAGGAPTPTPLDVEVGEDESIRVDLSLEGHHPTHVFVAASDPEVIEVELVEEAQASEKELRSTPEGATVFVDGQERGTTPLTLEVDPDSLARCGAPPRRPRLRTPLCRRDRPRHD